MICYNLNSIFYIPFRSKMRKERQIIILGIDGLEYDLVEEWDLKYLKQKAYCKTDLSDFDVIITPVIWGSMITGRKLREIEEPYLKRMRFFSKQARTVRKKQQQYTWAKILKFILPNRVKNFLIKYFTPDPFKKTYNIIKKKGYTTLFDFFNNVWHNGIPGYNRNVTTKEAKKLMDIATKGNIYPLFKYSMDIYKEEKKQLLKALEKNYDLIFWYTPFLDKIEHFYITNKAKLLNIYLELNNLVKMVTEKIGKNGLIYIISDHGMEPVKDDPRGGDHSDHGFFSSNTGELIYKPQDLFYLIKKRATKKI